MSASKAETPAFISAFIQQNPGTRAVFRDGVWLVKCKTCNKALYIEQTMTESSSFQGEDGSFYQGKLYVDDSYRTLRCSCSGKEYVFDFDGTPEIPYKSYY